MTNAEYRERTAQRHDEAAKQYDAWAIEQPNLSVHYKEQARKQRDCAAYWRNR
jgi:hypothetical protein